METPLVHYRALVQYLDETSNGIDNLVSSDLYYKDYKKAKKETLKLIENARLARKRIVKAVIFPEMLEENLIKYAKIGDDL